jgi:Outer membrane protein beta-barrel domain
MKKNLLRLGVSTLAVLSAMPSAAQDFYVGLGAEFGNGTAIGLSSLDSELQSFSLLAGGRYTFANKMFLGGEIETSLSTDYSITEVDYDFDSLRRARLLFGYDFGTFRAFGAYGVGEAQGNLSGFGPGKYSGKTWGIGGEYDVNDRIGLRVEAMRDDFDFENNSGYGWENQSLRAAAVVKF